MAYSMASFDSDLATHLNHTVQGIQTMSARLLRSMMIPSIPQHPHEHGYGLCHDLMLFQLYFTSTEVPRDSVSFLRCFMTYTLARVNNHLKGHRQGTVSDSGVRWDLLGRVMLHAIEASVQLELVWPSSELGVLYASTGFVSAMEMICRAGSDVGSTCHMLPLAKTLAGSAYLICWAVKQSRAPERARTKARVPAAAKARAERARTTSDAVSLSYLRTILKLLRMLDAPGAIHTHLGTQQKANMLHDAVQTLLVNYQFMGAHAHTHISDIRDPSDTRSQVQKQTALNIELEVTRAIVAGHRFANAAGVKSHSNTDFDPQQWQPLHSTDGRSHWETRMVELTTRSLSPPISCYNPLCTSLKGFSERGMKTMLCSGCKHARYCSQACQREDHPLHIEPCVFASACILMLPDV